MTRTILLAALLWPATALTAVHEVQIVNFDYQPQNVVIAPGDTVRWINDGGSHNVQADDGSFGNGAISSALWTYEFTFDEAGVNPYYCTAHGARGGIGMAGTVTVEGATEPTFAINEGLAGAWYEPATSGQGFFFDIDAELTIFTGAWFTWTDTIGEHDWLTFLDTSYEGDTAVAEFFRNDGG
ncbi:MAG TPA: plastocyanin/azurin family copper-binding protein, partial [Planctomycetaceae bacterium]|nr:plastocyanin/azurin family copper-binding protein [Planctomycetaceae bacterium]